MLDTSSSEVAAALAGDSEAFGRLTDAYHRELHVHCYRLLGSFHDAEDALQEALLRAWRHVGTFQGRSSFRSWLYRIATNVCLTQRHRRLPETPLIPSPLLEAASRSTEPWIRLSPYPDALLDELRANTGDPAGEYELHVSVQLAFLGAVQLLPPRQRAVLILRDVVGFSADDVAGMLDSSVASVNSALNRARVSLAQQRATGRLRDERPRAGRSAAADDVARSLARRYAEAWQAEDIDELVGLLTSDVVLTMPPLPLRYTGRKAAAEFFRTIPRVNGSQLRFIATRANLQPALAVYRCQPDGGAYRAWGIWVLTLEHDAISAVTAFADASLLPAFSSQPELPVETIGETA